MAPRIRFEDVEVGEELPTRSNRIDRAQLVRYAGASGDFNPLHWNEEFARSVGFPSVIAHGMFNMALVARVVGDWTGDPGVIRRLRVQFRKEVLPDETLVAKGRVVEKQERDRTVRVELWAELERDGRTIQAIKNGEALVELP
ncbi:MAG TPA: MaoC/PaaZ C-terminal domain-containing protein [Actinomycetota bacterium]|nr:MaoC/PaaZ C-terminal domain-containing protein [Actinomycetota bacterium]